MEKKFERISREVVYRSKWVNLFADKVIAPNGALIERYYPMNGISNKEYVIVCGELDAEFEKLPNFDESEVSECGWFDLHAISTMIDSNEIMVGSAGWRCRKTRQFNIRLRTT